METFLFLYEKCRLCLEHTGEISIFGSESTELAENIFLCTGLRIQPKDGLPQKICNKCLEVVQNAKQLRDQASRNNTHLRSLFVVDGVDATETLTQCSEQDTNETTNNENKHEMMMGPSRNISVRKDLFEFEPSSTETSPTKNPVDTKTQEEHMDDVHSCKKIRLDDDTVLYECPMSVSRHKQSRDVINACLKNCNIKQDSNSPYNIKATDPNDTFIKISAVDEDLIFAPQSISNDTVELRDPLGSDTSIDGTVDEQVIYSEESIYLVIEQNVPEPETITEVSTENTTKDLEDIGIIEKEERNIPNTQEERSIEQEEITAVSTSKHVEDIDLVPLNLQTRLDERCDNIDKSSIKGRKRKFPDQNREIRKRKANTNQDYISENGKKVKCKTFKGNDFHCHCPKKCTEKLSADDRKVEFDKFWKAGSYEARCALLQGYVKEMNKKRSYSVNSTKRKFSRKYYLQNIEICKKTFLSTFCISSSRIGIALTKSRNKESTRDKRGVNSGGHNRITSAQLAEIYDFIDSLPRYTSRCNRNSNPSTYLVPKILPTLYNKYKANSNSPVSFSRFRQSFVKDFTVPDEETITVVSTENTSKNLEDIGLIERNITNIEESDITKERSIEQKEITAISTSKHVEDIDFVPLDLQPLSDERSDNIDRSPMKGRKRKFSDQNREIRKRKANTNQDYISANGKKVKCKTFKGNDFHCHCPKKCTEKLSADDRKVEFDKFWKAGSYEARCDLLQGYVKEMNKKRSYSVNSTRRKFSRKYYLQNIEICKKTLLSTLCISSKRIDIALTKSRNKESTRDKRGVNSGGHNRITSAQLAEIYDFIDSLPKYTSRCSRNSNSSTYLVPKIIRTLYNKYKVNSNSPVSFSRFRQSFVKDFTVPDEETITVVSTENTSKNLEDIGLIERNIPNIEENDITKERSIEQKEITAISTSKHVEDIDFDPLDLQTLLDERSDNIDKSPMKGRKRKFSDQNREIRKRKANTNQDYISANGKKVKCKTFKGNNFHCHCPKKCTEKLSADDRKVEFDKFWKAGSYEARCALLQGFVKEMNKRSNSVNSSRRKFSRKYYLQNIEICKKTFLNTLCISPSRIDSALTISRNNESICGNRSD